MTRLLTLLMVLAMALPCWGKTIYCDAAYAGGDDTGSALKPWNTLEEAMTDAQADTTDEILITPGTYTHASSYFEFYGAHISTTENLTLSRNGSTGTVTIAGRTGASTIVLLGTTAPTGGTLTFNNITFSQTGTQYAIRNTGFTTGCTVIFNSCSFVVGSGSPAPAFLGATTKALTLQYNLCTFN